MALGVIVFGCAGMFVARQQYQGLVWMRRLDASIDDPGNWNLPGVDEPLETGDSLRSGDDRAQRCIARTGGRPRVQRPVCENNR